MSDPRIEAVKNAGEHAATDYELFVARYDALRAYDAAHPLSSDIADMRAALDAAAELVPPQAGGDPAWLDEAFTAGAAAKLVSEGSVTAIVRAALRVASAHLTDDACVEAAVKVLAVPLCNWSVCHREVSEVARAALEAAGKAWLRACSHGLGEVAELPDRDACEHMTPEIARFDGAPE